MPASHIECLLRAKESLPLVRRHIFEAIYQRGLHPEDVAAGLGITSDELRREHRAMLRSLRGAVANN